MFVRFFTIVSASFLFVCAKSMECEILEENPRCMAVGGVSLLSSTCENPSLSAQSLRSEFSIFYESRYLMSELGTGKCTFLSPQEWGTFGVSLSGFGYEKYNRLCAGGQFARFLSPRVALGVGFDLRSYFYEGAEERLFRFGFRTGALVRVAERLNLTVWNCSWKRLDEDGFAHRVALGGSLNLKNDCRWLFEIEAFQFASYLYRTGFEYKFGSFYMRCGAKALPVAPALGCGFDMASFTFDFSASYHNQLGVSICGGAVFSF